MPIKKLIKYTKKDNSVPTPLLSWYYYSDEKPDSAQIDTLHVDQTNKCEASDQKIPPRKSNNTDNNNSGAPPAREARAWTEPHG